MHTQPQRYGLGGDEWPPQERTPLKVGCAESDLARSGAYGGPPCELPHRSMVHD